MAYLYASMTATEEPSQPATWTISKSRGGETFGIHTPTLYLSFDRETAEAMIRHLEMGLSQLRDVIRF